jgi:hypothetical protein
VSFSASIPEKFLEPLRRQSGIAGGVLNIAVPEIGLDGARVMAIIGELVAAGVPEHVSMRIDAQISSGGCPLHHAREGGCRQWRIALRDKYEWGSRAFPLMSAKLAHRAHTQGVRCSGERSRHVGFTPDSGRVSATK